MKIFTAIIMTVVITSLGLFATGCPSRTSIADIEANPGRFQNKEVAVAGIVRDSYGISIPGTKFGGGAYKIDDGTGSIWVLVTDGNVPSKGSEIAVVGKIGNGIDWKGRNYGLGLYEKERHYKKR